MPFVSTPDGSKKCRLRQQSVPRPGPVKCLPAVRSFGARSRRRPQTTGLPYFLLCSAPARMFRRHPRRFSSRALLPSAPAAVATVGGLSHFARRRERVFEALMQSPLFAEFIEAAPFDGQFMQDRYGLTPQSYAVAVQSCFLDAFLIARQLAERKTSASPCADGGTGKKHAEPPPEPATSFRSLVSRISGRFRI